MRKWPRLLIAGIIVGLLGFYPLLAPPAHRIDQEHFELIQKGMTLGEVESIFGQPPGSYDWAVADDGIMRIWDVPGGKRIGIRTARIIWPSNNVVTVAFSPDGRLLATSPTSKNSRFVTSVFLGTPIGADATTWTSRHGTCTIWFDENNRVSNKSSWGESRVEPPWQKWWKKLFGEE